MLATILAFIKGLVELLGLGKWIYNTTKKTPAQQEQDIEASNTEEREDAATDGRPKWD
jgi:hypothetical protein